MLFGCSKANAVLVGVNWRLAPREMADILRDAEAKVLVFGDEFTGHLETVEPELGPMTNIVSLGGHDRHECYECYERWIGAQPDTDLQVTAAGDDVAIQTYTSGTTGLPKGVMLTNDNFLSLMGVSKAWGYEPDSVTLVCMPLFHMAGTGWGLPRSSTAPTWCCCATRTRE